MRGDVINPVNQAFGANAALRVTAAPSQRTHFQISALALLRHSSSVVPLVIMAT